MNIHDLVGNAGVVCVLGSYLAAQVDRIDPKGAPFLTVNGIGSLLVLYSLLFHYNQSAFVIQICWTAISAVGLVRLTLSRRRR